MFELKLFDRKGQELKLGDIVKISDGKNFKFFCEVTYLDNEKIIAPFHTFSFHSFEKVDAVPANAMLSSEERYKIWYLLWEEAEVDENSEKFNDYLMGWRQCEHLIDNRCYRIELKEEVS